MSQGFATASAVSGGNAHDHSGGDGAIIPSGGIAAGAVQASNLNSNIISGLDALAAMPGFTDELMISDSGTPKRIDFDVLMRMPSFLAYLSGAQSTTNNTNVTCALDTEDWDTEDAFESYTHTPKTAGKYLYIGSVGFYPMADGKPCQAFIAKNAVAAIGNTKVMASAATSEINIPVIGIIDMNGTTDYIQLWGKHINGDNVPILSAGRVTLLFGVRLPIDKDA